MKSPKSLLTLLWLTGLVVVSSVQLLVVNGTESGAIRVMPLTGWPTLISIDPVNARAYIGIHNFALGSVITLDIHDWRILRQASLPERPLAMDIWAQGNRVYVLTAGDALTHGQGSLTMLDADNGKVQRTIVVGTGPDSLAIDESLKLVLVTSQQGKAAVLTWYDASNLSRLASLRVAANALAIDVVAKQGLAAVVTSNEQLYLIEETAGKVIHVIQIGQGPAALAIDASIHRVYAINQASNTISVVDTSRGVLLGTTGVAPTPSAISVNDVAHRIIVTNAVDGSITILDGRTGALLGVVAVGTFPQTVILDGQTNYGVVQTSDGVSVIDATTGALLRHLSATPQGASALALNGSYALIAPSSEQSIQLLDLSGPSYNTRIPVEPIQNRGIAILRAFLEAYNAHDVQGVLSTLTNDVHYGDCDYLNVSGITMQNKTAVGAWLQARFADHDRFMQAQLQVVLPHRATPDAPLGATLVAIRSNDTLRALHHFVSQAAKIAIAPDGSHIEVLNMAGGADCL